MNTRLEPPLKLQYDARSRRLVRPAPVLTRRPDPPAPPKPEREYAPHELTAEEFLRRYCHQREAAGNPTFSAEAVADHERAVADALKRGVHVSDRVLKNYSHLKRINDPYR
jgi:hypothetical protein